MSTGLRDSRLINLRDSIPGTGSWFEGTGPRGFQMVEVRYPNGYGVSFQVEETTGPLGSYCGPGTVEARLVKHGGDVPLADLLWPRGNPLDPGRSCVYTYLDAEACRELARRVKELPLRNKKEMA
jgi:hypothetical protein